MSLLRLLSLVLLEERDSMEEREVREEREAVVSRLTVWSLCALLTGLTALVLALLSRIPVVGWTILLI